MERWTLGRLAQSAADVLTRAGVEQARLDADILLAAAMEMERLELYTRFDMPVDDLRRARFRRFIERRLNREPVAYIVGHRAFLDHVFEVGPGVLIPRPETEHVVEAGAVFLEGKTAPRLIEVGVGSGCIVISLLKRFPQARALGLDVSPRALDYARRNAEALDCLDRLELKESDVFSALEADSPWRSKVDLVVSNPPYVRRDETGELASEVIDHEPHEALFCTGDGTKLHRRILSEGLEFMAEEGGLVFELGAGSGAGLRAWAEETLAGLVSRVLPDYAGHDRVFCATLRPWPENFFALHGASATS